MRGQGLPLNTIIISIIVIVVLVVVILIFTGQSQQFVQATSNQCRLAGGTCSDTCASQDSLGTLACETGVCCSTGFFGAPSGSGNPPDYGGPVQLDDGLYIEASVPADARNVRARITAPDGSTDTITLSDSPGLTGDATEPAKLFRGTYRETDEPGDYEVEVLYENAQGQTITVSRRTYTVRIEPTRLTFASAYPEQGAIRDPVRLSARFDGVEPNFVMATITNHLGESSEVELTSTSATLSAQGLDEGDTSGEIYSGTWRSDEPGEFTVSITARTPDERRTWPNEAAFTRGELPDFEPTLIETRDLELSAQERGQALVRIQFPGYDAHVSLRFQIATIDLAETQVHGAIFRDFTGRLPGFEPGTYTPDVIIDHAGGRTVFEEAFEIIVSSDEVPTDTSTLEIEPASATPGDQVTFRAAAPEGSGTVEVKLTGPETIIIELDQSSPTSWVYSRAIEHEGTYAAGLRIDGRKGQATGSLTISSSEPELVSITLDPRSTSPGSPVRVSAYVRNALEPVTIEIEETDETVPLESRAGDLYEGSVTFDTSGTYTLTLSSGGMILGAGQTVTVDEKSEPVTRSGPEIRYDGVVVGSASLETGGEVRIRHWIEYDGTIESSTLLFGDRRIPAQAQSVDSDVSRIESSFIANDEGVFDITFEVETGSGTYAIDTGTRLTFTSTTSCTSSSQCSGACVYDGSEYACRSTCGAQGERVADADACCAGLEYDSGTCNSPVTRDQLRIVFVPLGMSRSQMGAYESTANEVAERFSSLIFPSCTYDPIDEVILRTESCRNACDEDNDLSFDDGRGDPFNACKERIRSCVEEHTTSYDLIVAMADHGWPSQGGITRGRCDFNSDIGLTSLGSTSMTPTTTALHEIGHCLGLGHLYCGPQAPLQGVAGSCEREENKLDCYPPERPSDLRLLRIAATEHTSALFMSYCDGRTYGSHGTQYLQMSEHRVSRVYDACN